MCLIPKAAAGSASRHKANADCTTTAVTAADLQQHLRSTLRQRAHPKPNMSLFVERSVFSVRHGADLCRLDSG